MTDIPVIAVDGPGGDAATDCDGCPAGKTCCPSRYQPDRPHCIDVQLNPEHCGGCGRFCPDACQDGQCIAAPSCADAAPCPATLICDPESLVC